MTFCVKRTLRALGEIERRIVALSRRRARRDEHCVPLILAPGKKRDVRRIGDAQQIEQDVVGADVCIAQRAFGIGHLHVRGGIEELIQSSLALARRKAHQQLLRLSAAQRLARGPLHKGCAVDLRSRSLPQTAW